MQVSCALIAELIPWEFHFQQLLLFNLAGVGTARRPIQLQENPQNIGKFHIVALALFFRSDMIFICMVVNMFNCVMCRCFIHTRV